MLPVIVAAADDEPLLGPDDLCPDGEAFADEAFGDRVECSAPCHTYAMLPGNSAQAAAQSARSSLWTLPVRSTCSARAIAPFGIVLHAVGRVGHHQLGDASPSSALTVTASVLSPQTTRCGPRHQMSPATRHRGLGDRRNFVLVGQTLARPG